MHSCFCMLVIGSVLISISSAAELNIFGIANSIVVHRRTQEEQSTPRSDEGKRRKRSISSTDQTNIINKINSLRSSVGASNMNYLFYSSSIEDDAANWTSYCNYDAEIYTQTATYGLRISASNPPDHVSVLETVFSDSRFYYPLSSVNLQYVGADSRYCSRVLAEGQYVNSRYLTTYVFSFTSFFNKTQQQYTLGEQCTTCVSRSYWCYEGLCKDDCSDSDSNCYCNSYCLNCATTNRTTCKCQCLDGWIGSRCETRNGVNASTPTCSTTPRMSRTSTTTSTTIKSTTSIAPSIIKSTNKPNDAVTTSCSLKNLLFQLAFYATVALFLRF